MSQDIVSDGLNMIKNAKNSRKGSVVINRVSNVFISILKVMKQKKMIASYKMLNENKTVEVILENVTECRAIKPRFYVGKDGIDKYVRRYLPGRGIGTIIISTNKGLMTHEEAIEEKIGGSLIAYFY